MTDRERYTHAQLDRTVRSLHAVGGIYEDVAEYVEHDNRPHCTEEDPVPQLVDIDALIPATDNIRSSGWTGRDETAVFTEWAPENSTTRPGHTA